VTNSNRPQSLGFRELALLNLYASCQLTMSHEEFYARWDVTHKQMAVICNCSVITVNRWFTTTRLRRSPEPRHQRRLAEMHFLWEHYEQIPPELRERLCPPPGQQT
jgi:hypothetical protein